MVRIVRARSRAKGKICALLAVVAASLAWGGRSAGAAGEDRVVAASDVAHPERNPAWVLAADDKKPPVLVFPPTRGEGERPLLLFLHGMCDVPQNECPELVAGATSERFLACPTANLGCTGGGAIWSGDPKLRDANVEAAVARTRAAFPDRVAASGGTLFGFSLGSFVALDVAQRQKGGWKNLVLVGAKIEPDAAKLKAAGIESVLLGAGDGDMMKQHMLGVAKRLEKQGVRVRFLGMGKVGHWFSSDMEGWLSEGMAWLDGKREGA